MTDREFIYASCAGIHAGGSELLVAFLDAAVRMAARRLHVLSPYVNDAAFTDSSIRHDWHSVLRTAHATIVVRTPTAAESVLRSIPQRALPHSVLANPRLHTKVLIASTGDAHIALVGSQNLTAAALHENEEIGILIKPDATNELRGLVCRLRRVVEALASASTPYLSGGRECRIRNEATSFEDGKHGRSPRVFIRAESNLRIDETRKSRRP